MASAATLLDEDFTSSVNYLSQELQLLGVDNDIPTTGPYIASQSLLRVAWNLVQFIHCNSVASPESILSQEHERRLRDELQQSQTKIERCKKLLQDKEREIKSREAAIQQLRSDLKIQQNEKEELRLKAKKIAMEKEEICAQAVLTDKLRDNLRSKIDFGRTLGSQTESFAENVERLYISKTCKQTQEDKLLDAQQAICKLAESNQTLVAENLWMRDTFARLFKQLNDVRIEGNFLLEHLDVDVDVGDCPSQPDQTEYPDDVFNQPLALAIEKLRTISQAQVDGIRCILRLISKSRSTS